MTLADDIERYAEELPDDRAGWWFKENAARIAGELRKVEAMEQGWHDRQADVDFLFLWIEENDGKPSADMARAELECRP